MELLLIRHAQSENNAKPESQRVEDPGITLLGEQQASRLATQFVQWDVEHLVTSAFRRALLTADRLRSASGHRLVVWRHLHEVGGCYQGHEPGKYVGRPGMNEAEVRKHFGDVEFGEPLPESGWWSCEPYESGLQAASRAAEQGLRLIHEFRGARRVACVIHADFKALLLEALLGSQWPQYQQDSLVNTGVTWLTCDGERVRVKHFNYTPHLTAELISD